MKPKFGIEDLAAAMIGSTDHSDIRDDFSGYEYRVTVSNDGNLCYGSDPDCESFEGHFDFTDDLWDGVDQEKFLHNRALQDKGWYTCIDDPDEYSGLIDTLLSRADEQETLDNPNFRHTAETMYDAICEWL